ncbi:MAG: aldehyde dehydrogenase family protein [Chloroflexi bacterium]|nr:aldehyde dehydrogenase family protein [Chloroflexota bacterium]MDA1145634.1 aldehyde dehydrogenase family protein [Chloroflexota bacterium]
MDELTHLEAGMPIVYGGNRVAHVDADLANAFSEGDRLVVVQTTGDLLHIPADVWRIAQDAVGAASDAFAQMGSVTDDQISAFFEAFARRLEDDATFAPIAAANAADVASAQARGRTTTRLVLSAGMRADMVSGLRMWRDAPGGSGEVVEEIQHEGWRIEQVRAGLGPVGFVFEGRPNVFADATGVMRSGNTVVFRIGSDALGTAQAIVEHALDPALAEAGLPAGAASLVASASRAAGWAMFSDPRVALAVARGSGFAVAQLGAVARQAGLPVSLHGTGGAWIVGATTADAANFTAAVANSLDRKTCNTLNTCAIVASRKDDLVPAFLDGIRRVQQRQDVCVKLHVVQGFEDLIPREWFAEQPIGRAEGDVVEPQTELITADRLGEEWEWEASPEVTLTIVPDVDTAVRLFNEQSPRFAASLISEDRDEHERFYNLIDSPFIGDGMTRWVDGQYALGRPELGLSNWQFGRLFGRGGVLSGDSVFTVRTRAFQSDPDLGR